MSKILGKQELEGKIYNVGTSCRHMEYNNGPSNWKMQTREQLLDHILRALEVVTAQVEVLEDIAKTHTIAEQMAYDPFTDDDAARTASIFYQCIERDGDVSEWFLFSDNSLLKRVNGKTEFVEVNHV